MTYLVELSVEPFGIRSRLERNESEEDNGYSEYGGFEGLTRADCIPHGQYPKKHNAEKNHYLEHGNNQSGSRRGRCGLSDRGVRTRVTHIGGEWGAG